MKLLKRCEPNQTVPYHISPARPDPSDGGNNITINFENIATL